MISPLGIVERIGLALGRLGFVRFWFELPAGLVLLAAGAGLTALAFGLIGFAVALIGLGFLAVDFVKFDLD